MLERFLDLFEIIGAILLCRSDAPLMITSTEIEYLREISQLFERLTTDICAQNYNTPTIPSQQLEPNLS